MPERFDLVVRGGTVVTTRVTFAADVGIRDGRFAAIEPPGRLAGAATEEVDAAGLQVVPGIIDGHVHFREPGLTAKEDWSTGSVAAVMGGVTTVIDMPNTVPPTASADEVRRKQAIIVARSWCDAGVIGLVDGGSLDEIQAMAEAGVVGFKAFLGTTVGDIAPPDDAVLLAGMRDVARAGLRLGVHAESDEVIAREIARLRAAGRTDPLAHLEARPVAAEVEALERVFRLAVGSGVKLHVFHLSSADGLAVVERWRAKGLDITAELTPHHAFMSAPDMARLGSLLRINPPVREQGHGDALIAALADGRITSIATDHSPHERALKLQPDIWRAVSGFAGVETSLRLFLTFGVHAGRLTLQQLVQATAARPAWTWGLRRKGRIEVGADADLALVDLERRGVIRESELHSRNPISPWEGVETRGMAVATILRGTVVMRDGELPGSPTGRDIRTGDPAP